MIFHFEHEESTFASIIEVLLLYSGLGLSFWMVLICESLFIGPNKTSAQAQSVRFELHCNKKFKPVFRFGQIIFCTLSHVHQSPF